MSRKLFFTVLLGLGLVSIFAGVSPAQLAPAYQPTTYPTTPQPVYNNGPVLGRYFETMNDVIAAERAAGLTPSTQYLPQYTQPQYTQPVPATGAAPVTGNYRRDRYGDPRFYTDQRLLPAQPTGTAPVWKLGVNVQNLEIGVRITSVRPDSPAARAGIEPNDILVTINGFQVGYVNGQLYDISDEFASRADTYGRARLVIQNIRTGALAVRDVQLERGNGGIVPPTTTARPTVLAVRGTVTYRDRVALPSTAILSVRLLDVTRTDVPATVVAETNLTRLVTAPFAFELPYASDRIDPRNTYVVQARILIDGQVYFVNSGIYPVITGGRPTDANILVESVR